MDLIFLIHTTFFLTSISLIYSPIERILITYEAQDWRPVFPLVSYPPDSPNSYISLYCSFYLFFEPLAFNRTPYDMGGMACIA